MAIIAHVVEFMEHRRNIVFIALALAIIAAIPRFYDLGSLSFYGDEEITAFAARSLAVGEGSRMPSGMPYYRALPFTFMTALSASHFGLDRELSYRIPAAVFGTLTVPLLFLLARPFLGDSVALVAAVLLTFSEWHIATSREARMYAPFIFFYIAAAFASLRWALGAKGKDLILATLLIAASLSFHQLGMIGVMFLVLPLAFCGWARVAPGPLLAAACGVVLAGFAYDKYFVSAPYQSWFSARAAIGMASSADRYAFLGRITELPNWSILLAMIGGSVGLWVAARTTPEDRAPGSALRSLARYTGALAAAAFACIGQLFAASICAILFLYLHPGDRAKLFKTTKVPLIAIGLISVSWVAIVIAQRGLMPGLKMLLTYPFPYPLLVLPMFPVVALIFLGLIAYLAFRRPRVEDYFLRTCVLAVVLPFAAVGSISRWGGVRYLMETYPFLVLSVSSALIASVAYFSQRLKGWSEQKTMIAALGIAVSGILTGHGVPQAYAIAALKHGEILDTSDHAIYPDHKASGEFVRQNLRPGDVVVAEDPLQQRWYVGAVDYWLRDPSDARAYLYRASDGKLHDIYVNSVLIEHLGALDDILDDIRDHANGRIWLITSAETYMQRDYYLSPEQKRWLESIEHTTKPSFTGRDGVTKVYCLNCSSASER